MKKILAITVCVALVAGGVWFFLQQPKTPQLIVEQPAQAPAKARLAIPEEKVIDYGKLRDAKDDELSQLMEERKATYGVEKSIDMIVKSDESIKVGEQTVQMEKILDQVRLNQGEILETDLATGTVKGKPREYGIHVVQPSDNIWDVHFKLLKDYYDHKGIQISPLADEPDRGGKSSGVGKILKFSEHMVHIYNVKDGKLESDLDLIYPMSKIVVYNMSYIFALLDRIDYQDVERIEFDGETLWLPAEL
jgi:hypothetical protein